MVFAPLEPEVLGPFLVAVALIELTPGPNMAYLAVVGASQGRAAGLAVVVGVTLGLAAYMVSAAVGVAEGVSRLPWLYAGLRWAGVLYLLWLAYETWRGEAETSPGDAAAPAQNTGRHVLRGFLANVLNPKAAVFYVALLPGFVRPERGDVALQTLTLGAVHLAVSVAVHGAIVLAAARAGSAFADRWSKAPAARRGFALAIAATALWLAWQTR